MNQHDILKKAARTSREQRVRVKEVNTEKRLVTAQNSRGAFVQISLDLARPVVSVPKTDEDWIAKTDDGMYWHLDRKVETDPITPVEEMSGGDQRLETPGTLYLNGGENVVINFGGSKLYVEDGGLFFESPDGTRICIV
jgi:hypothetical protein